MQAPMLIISISIAAACAVFIGLMIKKSSGERKIENAEEKSAKIIEKAHADAQKVLSKAHQDAQGIIAKSRSTIDNEIKSRRQSVKEIEDRVLLKEKNVTDKELRLDEKEEFIRREQDHIKHIKKKQEQLVVELSEKLENAAGFSKEEAKEILLQNVEREVRDRAGKMIKDIEEKSKQIANRKAKEIITDAIQRTAMDHVTPATTSVVKLPDDEMKGRIIGKEGRNIRAFEGATGVDVIIDDTPGAVVLSAFDPIRREIAKMTMAKLVVDGRIHPTRIEETVEECRKELKDITIERGEKAVDSLGLKLHPKIIEYVGRLYYRTSYGQNMLTHSIESAQLAAHMAELLGVNVDLAKRGALLHDIGKAIDFEIGGSHVDAGDDICRKYGESEEVINCINAHHEDEAPETIEAVIVCVADAISSVRPGARRESVETYIKRLEKLEALAKSFEGVDKAYAIQAGREIRVVVKPDEVDDPGAHKLALDMAKKIESELDYPGEVQVSIIRETRAIGVAR